MMLVVENESFQAYDSQKISSAHKLRIFTKLLKEPVVVSGSAYRSGAHPVLATRVASEVARSPKVGLVELLMEECKQAFLEQNFSKAIVKSLAAEELLRKYGGILASNEETEIREQLQFLKIHYFLLSGQAGEAYRVLCDMPQRSRPYLWHRRASQKCGVTIEHWEKLAGMLSQFFLTNRSDIIYSLLGYAQAMGSNPKRVEKLSEQLSYQPTTGRQLYEALNRDYRYLVTASTHGIGDYLPEYLAAECRVTPLFRAGRSLFVGSVGELSELARREVEVRVELEIVSVPMESTQIEGRNRLVYLTS